MVRLQFPFEDEEKSIYYLNRILEKDKYNFEALIIKMYLQNFYYGKMDDDFYNLINHEWDSSDKKSVVYYIMSWQFEEDDKKEEYLKKAINEYSCYVWMFKKLGYIYKMKSMYKNAYECYYKALHNVKTTDFPPECAIRKEAFIEEYILGTSISTINYDMLRKDVDIIKSYCQIR